MPDELSGRQTTVETGLPGQVDDIDLDIPAYTGGIAAGVSRDYFSSGNSYYLISLMLINTYSNHEGPSLTEYESDMSISTIESELNIKKTLDGRFVNLPNSNNSYTNEDLMKIAKNECDEFTQITMHIMNSLTNIPEFQAGFDEVRRIQTEPQKIL